jgi:3-hydroxyacyl-[acyl-carrier-protein] dehydratase
MLDVKEIQKILPHRYPFLLVDRIEEIEPGKRAVGLKNVTINEYFFQGHYPNEPVMPGVLIVEALAQVGATALMTMKEYEGKTPLFAGINKARFKRMVVPGDTLKLEVEILKLKGPIGIGLGKAYVEGKLAAEAELMFAFK